MLVANIPRVDGRSQRTRALLQRCALELFSERGYDATTVADIAAAAGVTPMTFFRHFPTKESVVLDDPYDPLIGRAVADEPVELAPLERVRRGLLRAWSQVPEPEDRATRQRVRVVAGHRSLRAAMWESNQATADVVASALEGTGVPRLAARAAAAACLGALVAALLDWGEGEGGEPLGARIVQALEVLAPVATPVGAPVDAVVPAGGGT